MDTQPWQTAEVNNQKAADEVSLHVSKALTFAAEVASKHENQVPQAKESKETEAAEIPTTASAGATEAQELPDAALAEVAEAKPPEMVIFTTEDVVLQDPKPLELEASVPNVVAQAPEVLDDLASSAKSQVKDLESNCPRPPLHENVASLQTPQVAVEEGPSEGGKQTPPKVDAMTSLSAEQVRADIWTKQERKTSRKPRPNTDLPDAALPEAPKPETWGKDACLSPQEQCPPKKRGRKPKEENQGEKDKNTKGKKAWHGVLAVILQQ